MSRILITYLSLGGTTAQVAERIAAGLRSASHDVDLSNLARQQAPAPDGYAVLGIGAPAYYFRPPFTVMDYVQSLPDLAGCPVFVFVLYGSYRGDTGNRLRRALAGKKAQEV